MYCLRFSHFDSSPCMTHDCMQAHACRKQLKLDKKCASRGDLLAISGLCPLAQTGNTLWDGGLCTQLCEVRQCKITNTYTSPVTGELAPLFMPWSIITNSCLICLFFTCSWLFLHESLLLQIGALLLGLLYPPQKAPSPMDHVSDRAVSHIGCESGFY